MEGLDKLDLYEIEVVLVDRTSLFDKIFAGVRNQVLAIRYCPSQYAIVEGGFLELVDADKIKNKITYKEVREVNRAGYNLSRRFLQKVVKTRLPIVHPKEFLSTYVKLANLSEETWTVARETLKLERGEYFKSFSAYSLNQKQ